MNTEQLKKALATSLRSATIRTRRPGQLFQVEIPCYLADGDSALIYVRPESDDKVAVTDLGHTWMRLSYTRRLNERHEHALAELAARYGFEFQGGQVFTVVAPTDILAAALGLAQIQTGAEVALASSTPRLSVERFKKIVRDALVEAFMDRCQLDYRDPEDEHGLWTMDAAILGPTWLGVAIVPSDLEAERAIANKGHLDPLMEARRTRHRWVAIPRDVYQLADVTKRRLQESFLTPIPVYDEHSPRLRETLGDLADLRVLN